MASSELILFEDDATYVADLEFAARIGKILLEQNKELEDHSKLLQEKIADQDAKILHLEKQLNVLRDLEDYRCKVYDQLQTNCQEFETENQQLIRRHHLATEQIKRLKILSDEQELQLNNLTSELNILKINSSHSSSVPKHESSPPRRKRCSSVPTSQDDFKCLTEEMVPLTLMENKVDQISSDLDDERKRCIRLQRDLESMAADYEFKKNELNQFKEQKKELVNLSRVQSDRIVQLEEENLYQRSSKPDQIQPLKTDLMRDLDDKYRTLQNKYNKLVSHIDKNGQMNKRPSKAPEYNDIFRRMFEVLSDSIDRNRPVRDLVRNKTDDHIHDETYSSSARAETMTTSLSTSPMQELEITLPNSDQVMSGNVLDAT